MESRLRPVFSQAIPQALRAQLFSKCSQYNSKNGKDKPWLIRLHTSDERSRAATAMIRRDGAVMNVKSRVSFRGSETRITLL